MAIGVTEGFIIKGENNHYGTKFSQALNHFHLEPKYCTKEQLKIPLFVAFNCVEHRWV